ncbi:MAG: hypothetical protein LBV72_05500 [Tannerella sp.]|jgi:hypothetical protein|nr:hypothetical protein [Tannerella sp.]
MFIELSKSQKKIARELIENSLQMECARFLEEIEKSISNQGQECKSPHEAYLNLYKNVKSFDKHIAKRYDDLRGSRYFIVLVGLFLDNILTQEDLNRFDEDVREKLLNTAKLLSNDSEL